MLDAIRHQPASVRRVVEHEFHSVERLAAETRRGDIHFADFAARAVEDQLREAALAWQLEQRWSVRLYPERLRPAAALVVPEPDGGWRRVSCYRANGLQPVVPGAVSHPMGVTAGCDPTAAALQELLRRGRVL